MSGVEDKSIAELETELVSAEERAHILSDTRLKFILAVFMTAISLGLSILMFSGVDRIFSWLTPSISNDLQQKALHGALELAHSAQLGIVTADDQAVGETVIEYERDSDVTGLLVTTQESSHVLYSKAQLGLSKFAALLQRKRGAVHDLGPYYGAWMSSEIEGAQVGKVALLVNKARLDAGEQLRREVLRLAAIGCLAALVASLIFVSMYIGPILRVTAKTFERLERTTEAALAAARLKSQFLANMSHEIRTPMNGIIGVLDLLNRTGLTPKQKRYTQTIDSSARSLLTIINDILDFSKLEAGKYEIRQDDFDLTQLVQDATELLSPKAHAKGLELVVRTAPNVPIDVRGDSERLKQVIINLLGNAIKFTEHGHIELRVSVDEATSEHIMLRFAIVDTGVGIRAEDQARLFGVFAQVDGSLTRKYGGTGLGLAISRRIAEAMGGACGVESEAGKGSTFWFTAKVGHATTATLSSRDSLRDVRVLLASTSEVQRSALAELMQRWGMRCDIATSSKEASELLLTPGSGFNVVLIDSSVRAASADEPDLAELCMVEDLPVIRLVATNEVAAQSAHSAQAFLWKPVRASELYNSILAISAGREVPLRMLEREAAPEEADGGGQGRVLVVDDNEVNRLVACELLSELGFEHETACNGQEAFDKVRTEHYDLVLMDCQMPGVDGFQATAMIRQLPDAKSRIPIIALTAHAMQEDRARVLRAGMDDYAAKPIRGRVLAALLSRWLPTVKGSEHADEKPASAAEAQSPQAEPASAEALLDPTLPRSRRVVELFLQTVPELIANLAQAVKEGDPAKVRPLAHKLKGNCLSLGAHRMAAVCHRVELAAAAGTIDLAAHSCIAAEHAAVTPLLTQVLETQATKDPQAASA